MWRKEFHGREEVMAPASKFEKGGMVGQSNGEDLNGISSPHVALLLDWIK